MRTRLLQNTTEGTWVEGPYLELYSHIPGEDRRIVWCAKEGSPCVGQWVNLEDQRGLVVAVGGAFFPDPDFHSVEIWIIPKTRGITLPFEDPDFTHKIADFYARRGIE